MVEDLTGKDPSSSEELFLQQQQETGTDLLYLLKTELRTKPVNTHPVK